jgi:hypothetical protein
MTDTVINFPVSIKQFAEHSMHKHAMLDAIARQENVEHLQGLNIDIFRCDWEPARYDYDREWLNIMKPGLFVHLEEWLTHHGYHTFNIAEIWFQQYITGSSHHWHTHSGNFTNVYYLDLPEDSPKTEWINPLTRQVHTFDVKEGDIITFPSWVIHKAPKNESREMKTIISWNMDVSISDTYGENKNGND